jgi:peptide/nickel transport system substrate-binding protein
MGTSSYWTQRTNRRISRRRAVAGSLALAGGAVALAACGSESRTSGARDLTLASAKDTSAQAVRGGVLRSYMSREPLTFDVGTSDVSTTHAFGSRFFSRLLKIKSGPGVDYAAQLPEGDFAESWSTPDGLVWTFKVRQGARMQNLPPLDGRPFDAEDVTMSWERFKAKNPKRGRYSMVDSLTAIDSRTVEVKLKYPYAPFLRILADTLGFWVMPKEYAQEKLDPRNAAVGSGPWILDKHRPSALIEVRRNPDYFIAGLPYIERIELPLLTETAQQRAQFLARAIYSYTPSADDVWTLRADVPDALMWKGEWTVGWPVIFFGRKEVDPMFHDVRVRRALSMAIDRDEFIDTFYDVAGSKKRGMSYETRWSNMIAVGWPEWLDPKSKKMGYPDNAPGKWYRYDPAEAKKLLNAAGYANGINTVGFYFTGQSSDFMRRVQVTLDYFQRIGVRCQLEGQDYYTQFIPESVLKGNAKGIGFTPSGEFNEVDQMLYDHFMPQRNYWDPPGQVSGPEGTSNRNPANFADATISELIEKQRRTLDMEERKGIIHDIQVRLSDLMWEIPWNGEADTVYSFTYPWVMNERVWRAVPDNSIHLWIDPKKAPS